MRLVIVHICFEPKECGNDIAEVVIILWYLRFI
jgi:hypothetical protein